MFSGKISYGEIILIVIAALLILIVYKLFYDGGSTSEQMINIKQAGNPTWSRSQCMYSMGETLESTLQKYNIKKTSGNSDMRIPCAYDEINKEINDINPNKDQRIFIIHDADNISAKDYLWKLLVQHRGLDQAKILMPNTYITYSPEDMSRFKSEYKRGNIYIMKKNIQRQEGLKITDSYDDIVNSRGSYVVVQELQQDPYIINGRKINMRFYILVVCNEDNVDVYVYSNGFMYYTKEPFKTGSKDFGPNITTGYIERWVYQVNPLTHEDFKIYLDKPGRQLSIPEKMIASQGLRVSDVVFNRIYNLLREVFLCSVGNICTGKKLKSAITFQLFGADIAINSQLWPTIMEINKGPDMGTKDERDGEVKMGCTKDMLRILGMISEPGPNGFIKVLDKENNRVNPVSI
jgi:hypothetical protein